MKNSALVIIVWDCYLPFTFLVLVGVCAILSADRLSFTVIYLCDQHHFYVDMQLLSILSLYAPFIPFPLKSKLLYALDICNETRENFCMHYSFL